MYAERTTLDISSVRKANPDGWQKSCQILRGHILAVHFDIYDGVFAGVVISAANLRGGAANFQRGAMDRAGLLGEVVFSVEIQEQGYGGRRTALNEERRGKLGVTVGFRLTQR